MTTHRNRVKEGAVARVWARMKAEWEDSDNRAVNVVLGFSAVVFWYEAYFPRRIVLLAFWFCLWQIASCIKKLMSAERQLRIARDGMLYVAFRECSCGEKADGQSVQELSWRRCHICRVRGALEEQFPGDIERRLRVDLSMGCHVPEDLAAFYLRPHELARAREQGQKWWEEFRSRL